MRVYATSSLAKYVRYAAQSSCIDGDEPRATQCTNATTQTPQLWPSVCCAHGACRTANVSMPSARSKQRKPAGSSALRASEPAMSRHHRAASLVAAQRVVHVDALCLELEHHQRPVVVAHVPRHKHALHAPLRDCARQRSAD